MEQIKTDTSHEQISAYNSEWVNLYEVEAVKLKEVFGDALLGVEHIGSTSVPGLPAKPIIDLMVLIDSHENAEKFINIQISNELILLRIYLSFNLICSF